MSRKSSNILLRRIIVCVVLVLIVVLILVGIISLISKLVGNKEEQKTDIQVSQNETGENIQDGAEDKDEAKETKTLEEKTKKSESKGQLPVWVDTAVQDIKDIYGSDEKQVFLTFDDGPSEEITPQILDILKEEDVPATFFVLGKNVKLYPELVKQEYDDGHFIANHGYTHTYSQIYSSVDSVVNEYNDTNEEIRKAIGNDEYDPHLFRFPGGSSGGPYDSLKAKAKKYLADNQVASTNWNCLTSDAAGNYSVDSQYKGALETQGKSTSLIVLMHDAADKKYTPETLRLLIKHYKEEGYEFKNFYEIFKERPEEVEETEIDENM